MKSTSKTALFFLIFLFVPLTAFAQIQISDVLYDAPGSDAGHEWIQISTTEAVDLSGYTLFEGGVHHALKVAVGTSTLAAGGSAIITASPEQYALDNPKYHGTIFKSSFSLSNSGETFSITDSSKKEVASYSYTAPPVAPKSAPIKSKSTHAPVSSIGTPVVPPISTVAVEADTKEAPSTHKSTVLWFSIGGLGAVIILGVVGVSLMDASTKQRETSTMAEEFQIE